MLIDRPPGTEPEESLERRVRIEQIDALFGVVTVAVLAAAAGAVVLAAILWQLGFATALSGFTWASYIALCALCHIALRRAYKASLHAGVAWPKWAALFTAISFAEGLGWGWAPIGLTVGGRFDVELLVVLVTLGISAGAMQAFGPYLPAFFALFLPATFSYVLANALSADPMQRLSCFLMIVFICAVAGIGMASNRRFKQHVALRIRSEQMAVALQSQKEIAERQKEIAEEASLAKSTFLAAASHDLRQPVHALGLFVGALRGVPMPPEGRRLLEQIEASTNAMDGLFTALLDISRLDAGIIEVHRRPFALGSLLDRVCGDHTEEAKAKGLSLTWTRSTAIVESDPVLIERILRNLLSNAVRYTDRGRIVVGCRRRGVMVSIQVWDTGRGIPADQRDRVFQEYCQLGNAERDRAKGLGLGLAIVRRLTDLLGAGLTLRSWPAQGSCFEIAVPRSEGIIWAGDPEPKASSGAPSQGLIVVIDDELAICEAMSTLLAGWGHDVVTAGSADEAMERLSTCPVRPDLIICDFRLRDGETGIAVIERLRSEYNETIPAMLVTGDTAPDRLADAHASGLLLLHKPVSNSKLRAAIVNLIATAETELMAEPDDVIAI